MSYDFGMWYEERPITNLDAGRRYVATLEADHPSGRPHPATVAALEAILHRWPALAGSEADDVSPWAMTPSLHGDLLSLTLTYPGARRVASDVVQLGLDHGLVVFDPQRNVVIWPSALEAFPHSRLTDQRGVVADDPTVEEVAAWIASLDRTNTYLILSTGDQRHMQTQRNDDGLFLVEYREGSPYRHFGVDGLDLAATQDLFARYQADGDHHSAVDWQQVRLD